MPLVTLPALGMLPRLAARPPHPSGSVVVVGNPRNDLPHAEREAQQVAEVLGAQPLIGGAATRGALLERLADARIVHLATHAQFDPTSPLDSGIVLADGVLTARDILQLRLQADLLVLSACETGVAGAVGGELAGLTQAFLQAGARSLIVSLWKIDDAATGNIMTSFHIDRQAGVSPDLALRDAMDRVRTQASGSGSYLWGPFVFIGDWTS
jgi:CHAT domain-containing protein